MSFRPKENPYSESDYELLLGRERHLFAWTLVRFGGVSQDDAQAMADDRYPYDPENQNGQGWLFHDTAWHWAMIAIHGSIFWETKPQLLLPPEEYYKESERIVAELTQ